MDYPIDLLKDEELATRLISYFSAEHLETIARSSRFVERSTSRLTGQNFLMLNVFDKANGKERSLTNQCDYLEEYFSLKMSKQGLDERYNTFAVKFMQSCYEHLLSEVLQDYSVEKSLAIPTVFKSIELADATSFKIPDFLETFYKGGGGVKASIKLQHRYNLLKGESISTKIVSGNENDSLFLPDLDPILEQDCLYIKDLGYFKLAHLAKIASADGYFLSRFRALTACFTEKDGQFTAISLQDVVKQPKYDAIYLGSGKDKLKVRMVIEPASSESTFKRLAKVRKSASTHHKQVQDDTLFLCYYNIYITNIEAADLSIGWIHLVYALRWQIELLFKIWKSLFEIDEIKKMSIFRFECYIYGRLIAILLTQKIENLFKERVWEEDEVELSDYKCIAILKKT
jgi:Transposase DDE domain